MVAGLVYNPANEELFIAERGKGAFLNDQRLRVAARRRLAEAVVACGLPHLGRGDLALFRREFAAMQEQVAGLRRFGAAALDLAWVAAGRLDAYWERDLSPWDMAAGMMLVREAGGYVTDLDGGDADLREAADHRRQRDPPRELLRAAQGSARNHRAFSAKLSRRIRFRQKWIAPGETERLPMHRIGRRSDGSDGMPPAKSVRDGDRQGKVLRQVIGRPSPVAADTGAFPRTFPSPVPSWRLCH